MYCYSSYNFHNDSDHFFPLTTFLLSEESKGVTESGKMLTVYLRPVKIQLNISLKYMPNTGFIFWNFYLWIIPLLPTKAKQTQIGWVFIHLSLKNTFIATNWNHIWLQILVHPLQIKVYSVIKKFGLSPTVLA